MKKNKKSLVFISLLMATCIVLLSACSNPIEPVPPSTEEKEVTTGESTEKPSTGEEASSGQAATSFTTSDYFDPPPSIHGNPWAPPGVGGMGEYVFDRLFEYVPFPEPKFIPMLGESIKEEGNKNIITLKKGLKWNDGTPFTSKDVLSSYYLGFMAGWAMWKYVDTIEAPDDYTVIINWKKPGPILSVMAVSNFMMGPYHIYGKWADQLAPLTEKRDEQGNLDKDANDAVAQIREDLYKFRPDITEVVGTGPYIVSNVTASEAILRKNPNFRETDNVKIDEVRVHRYVSIEAYLSNVMSKVYDGEPHGSAPDVFKQIEQNHPDMRIMWVPEYSQPSMQFNVSKYPVNNPKVRKAIMYAIDRDMLLSIAVPGTQKPDTYATGLVPSARDIWLDKNFLSNLEDYSYDPSKAEALLKELGWSKGSDGFWRDDKGQLVQLEVASMNSWPIFFLCGDAITNQLNQFGLKTEFKAMELSAYWEYLDTGQAMISFDLRAGIGSYGFPWEAYRNLYVDGAVRLGFKDPKSTDPVSLNITLSSGETVDPIKLIDELFYTVDKDRQKEIVQKLAQATNEFAPLMPIGEKAAPWKLYNTKLTGFPEDPKAPEWFGGAGMRPIAKLIKLGKLYYGE